MKDILYERIVMLATAQQKMIGITDKLEQWEKSQLTMEKNAFDVINTSDKAVNMSKEGELFTKQLKEFFLSHSSGVSEEEKRMILELINGILYHLHRISEASASNNDLSHKIELEASCQKEIEEEIKASLSSLGDSIDSALACAELMLSERQTE